MGYRINYRAAQGQQFAGTPGGGMLLDQYKMSWLNIASTVLPVSLPIGIMPDKDTVDFGVSILSDTEPTSFGIQYRIGRLSLVLNGNLASSASSPIVAVKRWRAGTSAGIATFDFTSIGASAWQPINRTGAQISVTCLVSADVLGLTVTSGGGGGGASFPGGTVLLDIEG